MLDSFNDVLVLVGLIIAAFVSAIVITRRAMALHGESRGVRFYRLEVRSAATAVHKKRMATQSMLEKNGGVVARILLTGLRNPTIGVDRLRSLIAEITASELPKLTLGLIELRAIMIGAPLLGLIGSLLSSARMLATVRASGAESDEYVQIANGLGGDCTQLIAGLIIALVTLIGYTYLRVQIENLRTEIDLATVQIVNERDLGESAEQLQDVYVAL